MLFCKRFTQVYYDRTGNLHTVSVKITKSTPTLQVIGDIFNFQYKKLTVSNLTRSLPITGWVLGITKNKSVTDLVGLGPGRVGFRLG